MISNPSKTQTYLASLSFLGIHSFSFSLHFPLSNYYFKDWSKKASFLFPGHQHFIFLLHSDPNFLLNQNRSSLSFSLSFLFICASNIHHSHHSHPHSGPPSAASSDSPSPAPSFSAVAAIRAGPTHSYTHTNKREKPFLFIPSLFVLRTPTATTTPTLVQIPLL